MKYLNLAVIIIFNLCSVLLLNNVSALPATDFISQWNTINGGGSASNQIRLPLTSNGVYNFTIDWGDSTTSLITSYNQAQVLHTYSSTGVKTLTIRGTIKGFRFGFSGDRLKITNIMQWGALKLGNDGGYFDGCSNMIVSAVDVLDLTETTDLSASFRRCSSMTNIPSLTQWDMSKITTIGLMFRQCDVFNQNLNGWNTAALRVTDQLFGSAHAFNGKLDQWNMTQVQTMDLMFADATSFDQDISNWKLPSVTTLGLNLYRLSTANYDKLLISWSQQTFASSSMTLDAGSSTYRNNSVAASARAVLKSKIGTITDGGAISTLQCFSGDPSNPDSCNIASSSTGATNGAISIGESCSLQVTLLVLSMLFIMVKAS